MVHGSHKNAHKTIRGQDGSTAAKPRRGIKSSEQILPSLNHQREKDRNAKETLTDCHAQRDSPFHFINAGLERLNELETAAAATYPLYNCTHAVETLLHVIHHNWRNWAVVINC